MIGSFTASFDSLKHQTVFISFADYHVKGKKRKILEETKFLFYGLMCLPHAVIVMWSQHILWMVFFFRCFGATGSNGVQMHAFVVLQE